MFRCHDNKPAHVLCINITKRCNDDVTESLILTLTGRAPAQLIRCCSFHLDEHRALRSHDNKPAHVLRINITKRCADDVTEALIVTLTGRAPAQLIRCCSFHLDEHRALVS
ncbi:hypothetical protein NDU88_006929 [Pleurodeles waltl]|uniref:Uncharacterized protein n=1 Tax=Pleurodeles waltl TaxID=8319 RepID=A0AAV7WFW8_PLEWA|nr:hypothetical protein NDU88_006929 [Pleurodeles waltl]